MRAKFNKYLSIISLSLALFSCGKINDPYELPDLYDLNIEEARKVIDSNIELEIEYIPSKTLIEGQILGYKSYEPGNVVEKKSKVVIEVSKRSLDATTVEDENNIIDYTSWMYRLTGPNSVNEEICFDHGVVGTDLGMPFTLPDGRIMMLYGDTFAAKNKAGYWNSNFMAITSDFDLSDGLEFDELVVRENGMVKPFAQGAHQNDDEFNKDVEVTKIPTGGISIGNNVYIFYMSVRYWGPNASWNVTYNQCVKASLDINGNPDYTNFVNVEGLRWDDDELYGAGQIYPVEEKNHPDYIYFLMTAGGRHYGSEMMRVKKENFENKDEYEYLTAKDTWTKGDEGIKKLGENPFFVLNIESLEPNLFYSSYLNKYVSMNRYPGYNALYVADDITGPYTPYICPTVPTSDMVDVGSGYGFFFHEKFSSHGGKRLFLQVSRWIEYQTSVYEVVLK